MEGDIRAVLVCAVVMLDASSSFMEEKGADVVIGAEDESCITNQLVSLFLFFLSSISFVFSSPFLFSSCGSIDETILLKENRFHHFIFPESVLKRMMMTNLKNMFISCLTAASCRSQLGRQVDRD